MTPQDTIGFWIHGQSSGYELRERFDAAPGPAAMAMAKVVTWDALLDMVKRLERKAQPDSRVAVIAIAPSGDREVFSATRESASWKRLLAAVAKRDDRRDAQEDRREAYKTFLARDD